MNIRTIIFVGLALALTGVASLPLLMHRSIKSRIGPEHTFTLSQQPVVLTEDLAVAKAREALSLDHMDPNIWLLGSNGCIISSNRAVVTFFTHGPAGTRFVHVGLDGSRVICQVSVGK